MSGKKIIGTHNGLSRIKTFSIEEVFGWIKESANRKIYWEENGFVIKNSMLYRARIYQEKGISCISCGLQGSFFAFEKDRGGGLHLDLYGKNDEEDVMLTIDHIVPSSKGGKNDKSNLQTMCKICNERKADSFAIDN